MTTTKTPYIERELSWLSFNERVLQEAMDPSVPIIERVRFLGIFSNNMDEFYRVRVADVRRRIVIASEHETNSDARHLLTKIQTKVLLLQQRFDATYHSLLMELSRRHIVLVNERQISDFHSAWLKEYFINKLRRHIAPLIVDDRIELAKQLNDGSTYLVVAMEREENTQYALVEVPSQNLPRFVELPAEQNKRHKRLILLDNIIRHCLEEIFIGYFEFDRIYAYSMKLTRDAEFDLHNELEQTLLEQMSSGLKQRLTAEPVRLVYDREMPDSMLDMLQQKLVFSSTEGMVPGGRYHSFKDFIEFPNPGRKYLEFPKHNALECPQFTRSANTFDAIRQRDILLYYPYHKFAHFTELLRQAAFDPSVKSIQICLYRVAKKSRVISSLIQAVKNGKQVKVVIELRARFDEEANIAWAQKLTDEGVEVYFGIANLKVHAKLCLITRRETDGERHYAHIGTGNFNERNAKIYTDFSLYTCDPAITREVAQVFDFIRHPYRHFNFRHLLVSPLNARNRLTEYIDNEIRNGQQGIKAGITLKINNLVDKQLIDKLYEASSRGVKIKLLVRGMCALVPGIAGVSDNIRVFSIVDRFLEHPRVMLFENGGDPKLFITSADWMKRNIDNRVEVGVPVYAPELKQMLIDLLHIQLTDNTKSRIINQEQSNPYRRRKNKRKVRSQVDIYQYLKNKQVADLAIIEASEAGRPTDTPSAPKKGKAQKRHREETAHE